LSSALGLDIEDDAISDTATEIDTVDEGTDQDTGDEGVIALSEELDGDDQAGGASPNGDAAMLPPWARKRVRSAPSLGARLSQEIPSEARVITSVVPGTSIFDL
jgi:hypothetical protein